MKLLGDFWSCSPEDYDNQYVTNSKSVRQAGEVVVLLAELLPKVRQRSRAACCCPREAYEAPCNAALQHGTRSYAAECCAML